MERLGRIGVAALFALVMILALSGITGAIIGIWLQIGRDLGWM